MFEHATISRHTTDEICFHKQVQGKGRKAYIYKMKWLLYFLGCLTVNIAHGQHVKIAIIDFYGNRSVPEKLLRDKLAFREGDSLSFGQVRPLRDSSIEQLKNTQ